MRINSTALEDQLSRVRELENRLTFRLSVVSKLLDRHSQTFLEGSQLNLSSYRILAVVHTFEQISISDISRFNAMDRAQVSRAAIELEKLGLVSFCADPQSKRKKMVTLTEQGLTTLEQIQPEFDKYRLRLEQALGPDNMQALSTGLARLTQVVSE
ncbi:MAG: MarR family winged helix-turn-helix transcriptional regulator [Granulosicoccus sp.]